MSFNELSGGGANALFRRQITCKVIHRHTLSIDTRRGLERIRMTMKGIIGCAEDHHSESGGEGEGTEVRGQRG
jgi:hypothetical protein